MTADIKPWMRIGYVSPHPLIDTLPYEFYLMAPKGVMMVASCLEIADYTLAAVEDQLAILDKRIEALVRRGAQRIVISGVPVAMALGRARTLELLQTLEVEWQLPFDTDLEAIIAGVRAAGASKVGLATRWNAAMNSALTGYLGDADVAVTAIASSPRTMVENAGLDDATGIALAIELGGQAMTGDGAPEALIIPGGRWITAGVVRTLEARFGRPVITNYTAGLWAALRASGYHQPVEGWGMLMGQLGDRP
jgi:maleate cis-trans isomerase